MSGVHFIDGQYYVEVDRDAKVDDYVTKDGILRTVTGINEEWDSVEFYDYVNDEGDRICGWGNGDYKTLEPLETVNESQASPEVIDMLANLARRVTQLEQQLADTQRNVETWAEELENAKHVASKALRLTGDHGGWLIRNAKRLDKSEELIEMLTDDVITLDERSQILSAINKYYAEGSR